MAQLAHLCSDGSWEICPVAEGRCALFDIHLPGAPAQLEQLPEPFLVELIEAVDPPDYSDGNAKLWYEDINGALGRGGDLPAVVYFDGSMFWYRDSAKHRGYDRPAVIMANGRKEWWVKGIQQRVEAP